MSSTTSGPSNEAKIDMQLVTASPQRLQCILLHIADGRPIERNGVSFGQEVLQAVAAAFGAGDGVGHEAGRGGHDSMVGVARSSSSRQPPADVAPPLSRSPTPPPVAPEEMEIESGSEKNGSTSAPSSEAAECGDKDEADDNRVACLDGFEAPVRTPAISHCGYMRRR